MNGSFAVRIDDIPCRQIILLIGVNLFALTTLDSQQLGVNPLLVYLGNLKTQNLDLTTLLLFPAVHMLLNCTVPGGETLNKQNPGLLCC